MWQKELKEKGKYTVDADVLDKLTELFWGGCCDEAKTQKTIKETFENYGYLIDTHTAVAVSVYEDYKKETADERPVVIASTASPYKFAHSVLDSLGIEVPADEFEAVDTLSDATKTTPPAPLSVLKTAKVRFSNLCEKQDMSKVVLNKLGIK